MKQSNLFPYSTFQVCSVDLTHESFHDLLETALPSEPCSEARLFLFSASRENLLHFFSIWTHKVSSLPFFSDFRERYILALKSDPFPNNSTPDFLFNPYQPWLNQFDLGRLSAILVDKSLLFLAINCLDHIELKRGLKFKQPEHSVRFFLAHIFVKLILSAELLVPPDKIRFAYNLYGKPYLANLSHDNSFSFNFSDSGIRCALLLSYNVEVGLDIEEDPLSLYQGNDKNLPLSTKAKEIVDSGLFFSHKEQLLIISEGNVQFYKHWTKKEAFLKWLGVGLVDNLSEIDLCKGSQLVTPQFKIIDREVLEENLMDSDIISFDFKQAAEIRSELFPNSSLLVPSSHDKIKTMSQDLQVDSCNNSCFVFTFECNELVISCAMTKPESTRLINLDEL